jgi:hypothetical protein
MLRQNRPTSARGFAQRVVGFGNAGCEAEAGGKGVTNDEDRRPMEADRRLRKTFSGKTPYTGGAWAH